ncbi:plasmid recombination protein, partial [Faecalibacterium prausnitzii]|uniref:plasmid recombination protein n=2 Tax=Oscillospiraceae TaxID=216572 RepID=UPI0020795E29
MKRRDVYLKLTRHNGRAGAQGTYNPKHNDRSFNLANSEHIDPERAKGNIYWDCFHSFRSALDPQDPDDLAATFSDVERQFYESRYSNFVESQNERNAKIRHTERNRSIPDLLSSRKTCPEETIYQLGTLDEHASAKDLLNIVTEFIEEFKAKFGEHVHVLDWALHLDESTPHIHERHVFDCKNKYGEIAPQQEKALEALGFNLPDPDKPLSRRNNRKITFDAACRKMLFEIAKLHGLELEEEAEYGNRKYLEKQDFILAKQKEQLTAQQNRLDELTLKVNDMETLIDEVSAAAYDKAVEVVTDVVRTETRKEDMRMIEDTKKWVLSPERKAPQTTREYAAHRLDTVLDKFLKTMQTTTARLQEKL